MILCDKVVCVNSQVAGGQQKIPYKQKKDIMPRLNKNILHRKICAKLENLSKNIFVYIDM